MDLGELECSEGEIVTGPGAWEGEGAEEEGDGSDGLESLLGNSGGRARHKFWKMPGRPKLGPTQLFPIENQMWFPDKIKIDW